MHVPCSSHVGGYPHIRWSPLLPFNPYHKKNRRPLHVATGLTMYYSVLFVWGCIPSHSLYTIWSFDAYEMLWITSDSCDAHPSSQHIPMISYIYIYMYQNMFVDQIKLNPQRSPFCRGWRGVVPRIPCLGLWRAESHCGSCLERDSRAVRCRDDGTTKTCNKWRKSGVMDNNGDINLMMVCEIIERDSINGY